MELKQFIKEALLNITDGIDEANKETGRFKILGIKHESGVDGNYAEFDVSVIVKEGSNSEIKNKIGTSLLNVVSAKVGSRVDQSKEYNNSHRLTFKVYITEK